MGALAGIVGAWQASEAVKVLLGIGEPLAGRLMLIESLGARVREVRFRARSGLRRLRRPAVDHAASQPSRAADDAIAGVDEIEPAALDAALAGALLLDVREPHEAVLGTLGGAIEIPASQLEARMHELDTRQALRRRVPRRRQIALGGSAAARGRVRAVVASARRLAGICRATSRLRILLIC